MPIIIDYLKAQPYTWELVIIDDGSHDSTSELATHLGKGFNCKVLRNEPNRGKGYSIRRGMREAKGKYRLFTDADLSTPIEELDKFWPLVEEGSSVVIGSRALPESQLDVRQPRSREFAGRLFNTFVQTFLVPGLSDTQCGFKLFTADAAEAVFSRQQLHGFAFDVEVLMLAHKLGYGIKEAPVRWVNDPGSKVSAMAGARGFYDLLRLKARKLQ
jgi:dolichyl-phosphate beta-glucosyltransferase